MEKMLIVASKACQFQSLYEQGVRRQSFPDETLASTSATPVGRLTRVVHIVVAPPESSNAMLLYCMGSTYFC